LLPLAILLPGAAMAATLVKTYPVNLAQRDRILLATAACKPVGVAEAVRIDATTRKKDSSDITAEVRCKPHTSVGAYPLLRYATCNNSGGSWRCDEGYDVIHMKLPDVPELPVVPRGVSPQMAIEAITEASKLQVPPFHHPAIYLMRGRCSVAPHPASPSPEMKLFDIGCDGTGMLLTRHCWKDGCRYFISEGYGY
jgi:hypothetical protein